MARSTDAPRRRLFEFPQISWWESTTSPWMAAAFLVAFATTVIVLTIFGAGHQGTVRALQATAWWSFALFWLAYTGSAMARLFGSRFAGLARRGREFGLAFASAHVVHVGLVLWVIYIAADSPDGMLFFWVGILCTYLLALFSLPRLREALGTRLWPIFHTVALEYIALVFAADFFLGPLQSNGFGGFPLNHLPFVLALIGGIGLRAAASIAALATKHYNI